MSTGGSENTQLHAASKISSEILKFSDCAIWYNPDDNYEDIDTDLGQMNLFVIPITTKLLTKPCRTIELDVPFALKKHIPILPLKQEMSLDELFTRKFGDLQYLDPNAHDITAISYEDKLKKYLNSVLVSDEMAEKVAKAALKEVTGTTVASTLNGKMPGVKILPLSGDPNSEPLIQLRGAISFAMNVSGLLRAINILDKYTRE